MREKRTVLCGFCIACTVFLFIAIRNSSVNASTPPPGPAHVVQFANSVNGGAPAIAPRSDGQLLTRTDISQYVTTHQSAGGPTTSGAFPQMKWDRLVTSKAAETLLKGEQTGLKDNAMVHVVLLHGPFVLTEMLAPPGVKIPTVSDIYEVFDAQTGNLLLWGTQQF